MTRFGKLLLGASVLALLLAQGARAETPSLELAVAIKAHFEQSELQLETLTGAAIDPAGKLALAKLYIKGLPAGPDNPVSQPDIVAATALLDEVIAGNQPLLRQQAQALRADILLRSTVATDRADGQALQLQLALDGHATSLARIVLRDGRLPEGLTIDAAKTTLEGGILSANYSAAFALSQLLAQTDPQRSTALASQALVLMSVGSDSNPSAATEMGRRYLYGIDVQPNIDRALTLLSFAAEQGANSALTVLNNAVRQNVAGLEIADARDIILKGMAAGSSRALDLIANDVADLPTYGFSSADGLYAISILAASGDRSAMLVAARAYVTGVGGPPDLAKALPYIESLSATEGLSSPDILKAGEALEALDLPLTLALKYIEPLYRKVSGTEADEGEYHADRLLALGTAAGILTPAQLGSARTAEIVATLRQAAGRGHASSLILLGDLYYGGIWVDINYRQAMQYYQRSLDIEPSLGGRERLAKTLLVAKKTPFEEQRYRSLIAQLADEGSQWGIFRRAMLLIEDNTDVASGETILLDLSSQAYVPAVRALLRHLKGVQNDPRIDKAVEAFSTAWSMRKDIRLGRQLAEFYGLAGRLEEARLVLADPIFAADPDAALELAKIEIALPVVDPVKVLEISQRGVDLAAGNQRLMLTFAGIMEGLQTPEGDAATSKVLLELADAGNVDAIIALFPKFAEYVESAETAGRVIAWSDALARSGEEAPLLALASEYLVPAADPDAAARVLNISQGALGFLPKQTYLAVLVAHAFYGGIGTGKDIDRGNALIESAAAAGSKDGLAELGMQFYYGMGRQRDRTTALALLDSAAALGSDVARVELGRLYSSATGPRVDMNKAYSMFLAAAENGSLPGMVELGRLYLAGWGIGEDEHTGVEWLERAAGLGSTDAMFQLYFHYLLKGDPGDRAVAMNWLHRSVDANVNSARVRLAATLLNENGTDPGAGNYDEAMGLLDDAFAAGYNLAAKYKRIVTTATASDLAAEPEEVGL